jgi:8-oxo-dGTP diphosphatase
VQKVANPTPSSSTITQHPRVGVAVLLKKDNQILLGKRKNAHGTGTWAPAGGHLEFGESIEECARRELLEETGLRALSLKPLTWTNNIIDANKHYVTLFMLVDEWEGALILKEPHKCEGWHWFDLDKLPEPLFPTVVSFFEKYQI